VIRALAVISGLVVLAGCASSDEPTRSAEWTVIANRSFCLADPGAAKLHFRITVRNEDDFVDAEADVRPWRRYSDNSVNDSGADALTLDVPAGETVTFRAEFGYDAEKHRLVECGVELNGLAEPVRFEVVGY
jgi:hypothetical protein